MGIETEPIGNQGDTESRPIETRGQEIEPKPNGPALAAILAAGIGSAVLGLLTVIAEASPSIKAALTWSTAVGPLSGKTGGAVIAWLAAWVILGQLWKGRDLDFPKVWLATLVLIGVGFLGTFPLFYDLFTAK